jgi:hypothetical protein
VWGIFILGAGQLALVIGGPFIFMIVNFCCAVLFAVFIFKVEFKPGRILEQIATLFALLTGILLWISGCRHLQHEQRSASVSS